LNIPGQIQFFQPKHFAARIECAEELKSVVKTKYNYVPKIFVDQMDNRLSELFAALPERLIVLQNGKIKFIGGKGPYQYSIPNLQTFIQKYL